MCTVSEFLLNNVPGGFFLYVVFVLGFFFLQKRSVEMIVGGNPPHATDMVVRD